MVGDLRALGMASSSMVLPRERVGVGAGAGAGDRVRLRMAMPWRCRSLRFCAERVSERERKRPAMAAVLLKTEDARKAATRAARALAGQPLAGPLLF